MSVYRIREENIYVVHNMKNIIVIIEIVEKGVLYGHCITLFIRFAPTTTQISCIKYFYVIDSI